MKCLLCMFSGSRAGDSPCVHPSTGSGSHHWKEGTAHQTAEPLCWGLHQGLYCIRNLQGIVHVEVEQYNIYKRNPLNTVNDTEILY